MTILKRSWLVALLALALLLAACEEEVQLTPGITPIATPSTAAQSTVTSAGTVPTFTSGPLPPTVTVAPTNTPEPPTSTPSPSPVPPTATPTPSITGDATLSGTLLLWHGWTGVEATALNKSLAYFAQFYPNVKIETEAIRVDQLGARFESEVAKQGGPDLLLGTPDQLGPYADLGLIYPLDELLAEAKGKLSPGATSALTYKGKLFAIPAGVETVALYYNKRLATNVPTTTAELLQSAQANGGLALVTTFFHTYGWLGAYGGPLFNAEGCAAPNSATVTAYLDYLKQLAVAPGITASTGDQELSPQFAEGKFGMIVNGPWAIEEYRRSLGPDLGVAPLPAGPVGAAAPLLDVRPLMINSNRGSEQHQLAATFVRFYLSPENGRLMLAEAGIIPGTTAPMNGEDAVTNGFLEQAQTASPAPVEIDAAWDLMDAALLAVLSGQAKPGQAAADAVAEIDRRNGKRCQ